MCWYCYWGCSLEVQAIYDKHVAVAGESAMDYGPAHIVWGDENYQRESVQWCLDRFDEYQHGHGDAELAAVRASLVDLLALPDHILDPEREDYDGEHPENYPPTVATTKRRA